MSKLHIVKSLLSALWPQPVDDDGFEEHWQELRDAEQLGAVHTAEDLPQKVRKGCDLAQETLGYIFCALGPGALALQMHVSLGTDARKLARVFMLVELIMVRLLHLVRLYFVLGSCPQNKCIEFCRLWTECCLYRSMCAMKLTCALLAS
jgi:hypothetical protein